MKQLPLSKLARLFTLGLVIGALPSAHAVNYFWDLSTAAGYTNGDGVWNATNTNFTTNGTTATAWVDGSNDAVFGGNNTIAASPTGDFVVTVEGTFTGNLRQAANGAGNYTLNSNGGAITISSGNGVRADQGIFTVNVNLTRTGTSSMYLTTSTGATLVLGGANTFNGGIYVQGGSTSAGTVKLNSTNALGTGTGTLQIVSNDAAGATLDLNGFGLLRTGLIQNAAESSTAAVAATSNLVNNHATTGVTLSNDIVLRATRKMALGGSGAGLTLNGQIRDSTGDPLGKLFTTGTGVLTLGRAAGNTYTGGTQVDDSTLLVTNTSGSGTGTGAVQVNATGKLGGTGFIAGATTIDGTLTAGLVGGIGTLTFTGAGNALTLHDTANTVMDIANPTPGTGYDRFILNGAGNSIVLDGTLTLNMTALIADGTYDLFTYSVETGEFNALAFSGGAYAGTFTNDGFGTWTALSNGQSFSFSEALGDLTVTSVPEPALGTLSLAALGLLTLVRRRNRSV